MSSSFDATQSSGNLPQGCLDHIKREESVLESLLESLREVRSALLKNDVDALGAALERQDEATQASEQIRGKRSEILQHAANSLGLPLESLTLKILADSVGGKAGQTLHNLRQRLTKMSTEVDRLNRANAAMLNQAVDLTRQVLAELTQSDMVCDRYDATGERETPVSGPIIEMGG